MHFIPFALQGFAQVEYSDLFPQDGLRITQVLSACTYPDPQGWIKNKQEQLLLSRDVFVILLSEGKPMSPNCLFKVPTTNPAVWHVPSYSLSPALFLHRFFFSPPACCGVPGHCSVYPYPLASPIEISILQGPFQMPLHWKPFLNSHRLWAIQCCGGGSGGEWVGKPDDASVVSAFHGSFSGTVTTPVSNQQPPSPPHR